MKKNKGKCSNCGKVEMYEVNSTDKSQCCNANITPFDDLPVCDHTVTAEQERVHKADDPCDDATNRS